METVTLTIDGQQVTADKGKTVLQAAIENGIKIPYYCYHPGLGIDGSCRVCIVKIEKMPKLQTSCSTPVAEGMVVSTQAPDVVEARASVLDQLPELGVGQPGAEKARDVRHVFAVAEVRMDERVEIAVLDAAGSPGDPHRQAGSLPEVWDGARA